MKKSFPLHAPGKDDARVRDKIRHEVNKYVRRVRRKPLPEGFDLLELSCRVGATSETALGLPLKEVGCTIDAVAATGVPAVYVEILGTPAVDPHSAARAKRLAERAAGEL
jgi:hypothetical protein